jgi:hypothetical protein
MSMSLLTFIYLVIRLVMEYLTIHQLDQHIALFRQSGMSLTCVLIHDNRATTDTFTEETDVQLLIVIPPCLHKLSLPMHHYLLSQLPEVVNWTLHWPFFMLRPEHHLVFCPVSMTVGALVDNASWERANPRLPAADRVHIDCNLHAVQNLQTKLYNRGPMINDYPD